jgi:hypothetical protein
MSYWFDYMVEKERRRQEMATAAARRQQAEYLNVNARPRRRQQRYQRFLAFVGEQLIILGSRLQSRYEVVSASTGALTAESVSCGAGPHSDGC